MRGLRLVEVQGFEALGIPLEIPKSKFLLVKVTPDVNPTQKLMGLLLDATAQFRKFLRTAHLRNYDVSTIMVASSI